MQIMKNKVENEGIVSIGVVRTDRIGDMILTLPMCRGIKEIVPKCKLFLIARRYVEPVLYKCEFIDEVVFIDDYNKDFKNIYGIFQPEVVFFPRPRFEEVYYAYKSSVPVRIGSAYRWYSFLFTHKIKDHRKVALFNEAKYNLRMVEFFFQKGLELKYVKINVEPEALKKIESLLETLNIQRGEYIILHPGSKGSSITWQAYKFGELAEILVRAGYNVVLTGVAQEAELNQIVQNYSSNIKNLTGRLNLYETIALISLAKGLVANSTGILHIGSVLEVPTVGLFPNTPHLSAKRWGPIGPFSTSISPKSIRPEDIDNMELIQPQEVYKELLGVISKKETEQLL